jgi:hypothetical protein
LYTTLWRPFFINFRWHCRSSKGASVEQK